jgi:hypothetical protein
MRRLNKKVGQLEARMIGQIGKDGRVALLALLHRLAAGDRRAVSKGKRRQPGSNRSLTSAGTG